MRGKSILYFDPDPKAGRIAERALSATGSAVHVASDRSDLMRRLDADRHDLIMTTCDSSAVDLEELTRSFDAIRAESPATRFVLHGKGAAEDYLPLLEQRSYLRNLIAKNSDPLEAGELIITAEKLLRNDIFGLHKYLLWGVEPLTLEIREARKKKEYLAEVLAYASGLGCGGRTLELIDGIVDELVTNVVFNAPRNPDGTARYAKLHRSEPVVLEDHEVAELSFACDGDFIAISSVDPFGSLTRETVVGYLARCLVKGPQQISDLSGGAGIGLYRVFQSLSKFVVNLAPGKKTEVITLIDLRLSMRQFRRAAKSFHFFVDES